MRAAPLLLLPALLAAGCESEFDNPFANATRTVPPRATAAVVFTSTINTPAGGREAYAIDADGSGLTQLTFCGAADRLCDIASISPAPDRQRVVARRRLDANGNARLEDGDGAALVFMDLVRSTQAELVPAATQVSAIDWAETGDVLVYAATGDGGLEDLFRADPNGANNRNLTASATVRERGGRVDPNATVAVYERLDPGAKTAIFVFVDRTRQVRITTPGEGTAALAGTPYVVGSDADGDFSPDGGSIVFRRLTGTGAGGLGTWDIMTVRTDGTGLAVVAGGPDF
ncbi:MAG TPA: hypothetical protein VFO85_07880, partial [Vicinamibacteria bacterium]|nr:hypothetical protein [Vicinamibacteria bacterium]